MITIKLTYENVETSRGMILSIESFSHSISTSFNIIQIIHNDFETHH
jgi:hypothetical protein